MRSLILRVAVLVLGGLTAAASLAGVPGGSVWNPDRGDGTYRNPVLFADYSDPDVIRAGDDFYLVSSSFASAPGLPILHSRDLVNWTLIGHAVPRLPWPEFDTPQHGKGLWAPSFRHHAGKFWIYVGDPDRGIFVTTASDPRGPWTPLALVKTARGAIDPCPLWDEDGKMYLVHAWAKSRAGFNSVLTVTPLSGDGLRVEGPDTQVFDGHANHPTIEGPKFYKRNGWYYIFAPAGGVATGWQTVLRSRNVYGPYEDRVVMRQGNTQVNGPHQGAWVETKAGESWFVHFQDRGVYGRVVHLQPMEWKNDWPVIGADRDGDGVGEPVAEFRKPVPGLPAVTPQTSDEFSAKTLGLQWQWNANPVAEASDLSARPGWLRLRAMARPASAHGLFDQPAVLLQKLPAEEFTVTARVDASALAVGERAGLVVLGRDTASIAIERAERGFVIVRSVARNADTGGAEEDVRDSSFPATVGKEGVITLRARFMKPGRVGFDLAEEGTGAEAAVPLFEMRPGVWVGARVGLFAAAAAGSSSAARGHADLDWFRVEPLREDHSK